MARKFYLESKNGFEVGQSLNIEGDEFLHVVKVLRHSVGDKLCVIDGYGFEYDSIITQVEKKSFSLEILNKVASMAETKNHIAVFQALVKGDKFELITQKLTELGVSKIVPFESEFCQVKSNTTRLDRLEKISVEALKQCGRAKKVCIEKVQSFAQMLENLKAYDTVIFAYEKATSDLEIGDFQIKSTPQNVAIIVGSEGGFSDEEAKQLSSLGNVKTITLGKRILRAETASITLAGIVMFGLGEFKLNGR